MTPTLSSSDWLLCASIVANIALLALGMLGTVSHLRLRREKRAQSKLFRALIHRLLTANREG